MSNPIYPEPGPGPSQPPEPNTVPWHDPGPPVRIVDLPPDSPAKGIPAESPEQPPSEPDRISP
jgi:hypothetical protein